MKPAGQQSVQVNFHQQPYDTPQRVWSFFGRQGHFLRNLINRIQWYEYPRRYYVSEFPLHVDIEATSRCNMNCPMCFRQNLTDLGDMKWDVFTTIVDECAEHDLFSVRLSWRGEALIHPRIFDMIEYAAERIPNVSFLTNTFFVTEKVADRLIELGLSYLGCSFDGIGDAYNMVRRPARYEDSLGKLEYLHRAREAKGAARPQVRACSIWPAVSSDPQAYYDALSPVADMVVVNNYKDFSAEPDPVPDFVCQYPWERLMVAHNGRVQCCTGWNSEDISLGSVPEQTLLDMWHSGKLNRIRELHRSGQREEVTGCSKCRHGNRLPDQSITIDEIVKRGH